MYTLLFLETHTGSVPFVEWLERLDSKTQARIRHRLTRLEAGHFGDYKLLTKGLFELRLFFGPGYRVYYGVLELQKVVLISGGDKSSQAKDIRKALALWETYQKEKKNGV